MIGASPTLGSLGHSHQWRHKSWVSLRGPPCAHGVSGTPHEEARNTNYLADGLWMEFYLRMMKTLMKRGDNIFNIFKGSKPIYAAMVSNFECWFMVWADRSKLCIVFVR